MEPDRTELLEQIITEGDRRKQRRRLLAAGGTGIAAVVLFAGIAVAWPGDDGRDEVTVADDSTTTSTDGEPDEAATTSSTSTSTTTDTTVALGTTTTATAGAGGAPTTGTTEITGPPPACRNSFDPACGPFSWDYDPATFPNAPLEVALAPDAPPVVVGQPMRFTATLRDADSPSGAANCATVAFGGGRQATGPDPYSVALDDAGIAHIPCVATSCADPGRYGPWDPPPPPTSSGPPPTYWFDVVFDAPGEHTIVVEVPGSEADCDGFGGYRSPGRVELTVQVLPA